MISVADILGAWKDAEFESSLIKRCRAAWDKPLDQLSNSEMATFLRQRIAVEVILPLANKRLDEDFHDDTEMDEDELRSTVNEAIKS